jgi:hypothetical protein
MAAIQVPRSMAYLKLILINKVLETGTNTMKKYGYFIESINEQNKTAVIKVQTSETDNNWFDFRSDITRLAVSISSVLLWRIRNRKEIATDPKYAAIRLLLGDDYVGQWFWSTDNEPNYWKNPFVLKHFKPTDGSNIPENFQLCAVDEAPYWNIYKQKYLTGRKKISAWKRYMKCDLVKTSDEITRSIVLPYAQVIKKGELS